MTELSQNTKKKFFDLFFIMLMVWAKCMLIAFKFQQGLFFILTNCQTYSGLRIWEVESWKITQFFPPKPPRKNMTHYAQPAVSGINSDIESVSSDFKRYQRKRLQEQTNEDSAIASGVPQWTRIENLFQKFWTNLLSVK